MTYVGPGYRRPTICNTDGCQLAAARKIMDQAEALVKEAEYQNYRATMGRTMEDMMSQALWCDSGEHAFSERDPDRQHLERTALDQAGNQITEPIDICGSCAQQNGLLKPSTLYPRPGSNESTRGPQASRAGLAPGTQIDPQ